MRLTSKGQVTIPQEIREKLGRKAGDKTRGRRMLEAMRKAPKPSMTTDEIMALTRGD